MCGICGFIGYENSFKYGYLGILKLLNRGYDSVGVTTINVNCSDEKCVFITHKYASDDNELADSKIIKHQSEHNGTISIFHSRWRTTGGKTDTNSHPHTDTKGKFSLVHNGIIENYVELKSFLLGKGFTFKSETDTEVIVNLISYHYLNNLGNPIEAIRIALSEIDGTYALAVLCIDTPDQLYCVRHGSPLLIGFPNDNKFAMLSSERHGFDVKINKYIIVDSNDIISLKKENGKVVMASYENKIYQNKEIELSSDFQPHTPFPHKHWTIKEIHDQSISCVNAIGMGGRILTDNSVRMGGLEMKKSLLLTARNLIILGCGTSHHAGLLSSHTFKSISGFNTVQVFDGAEFSIKDIPIDGDTCFIFVSQSGETKDLHRCVELCKELRKTGKKLCTLGVINTVDSLIAREVDCGTYLNCGREVAVASTKAFSSQLIVLTLIAIWFAQNRDLGTDERKILITKILRLQNDIVSTIDMNKDICKNIAKNLINKNSLFVLGKDLLNPIALEGSLKLKEIGYIHAEGYSSSALKHGPYALLNKDFPVILLTPNDNHFVRNQGILDELKSRDACVIGISDVELSDKYDYKIKIPLGSHTEITSTIVLQLISYYLSVEKGINPDYPRGIAKCLSVD